MPVDGLQASLERMRRAGTADHAMASFARYYERLVAGDRGLLAEHDIVPVESIVDVGDVADVDRALDRALDRVAIVRLNGGLGTTMAAGGGKGRLDLKHGLSFLELAAHQVAELRERTSSPLPLLLMNSAATGPAAMRARTGRPSLGGGLEEFWQSMVPRLGVDDLAPVDWPRDPTLEWAPPGHGEVYAALSASGRLRALLDDGYEYACISSIDNVASVVDGRIVSVMQQESIPFLMEVADRTYADRKGGHLARRLDGDLVLRELAQAPTGDRAAFQDIERHRYFNTNTIWVDLRELDALLTSTDLVLDLPLIANRKVVDPYDDSSPEVIQIESAMGAAISVFPGAAARRVERRGFNPVKSTAELLAVRSDAYGLTDGYRLELVPGRNGRAPIIELDPSYFGRQRDFDARFPAGPPSLIECDRLVVRGDVVFGGGVVIRGTVTVEHDGPGQRRIASGSVLSDA